MPTLLPALERVLTALLQAAQLSAALQSAHTADLEQCDLDEQRLLHAPATWPAQQPQHHQQQQQQQSVSLPSLGQCQLSTPSRPGRCGPGCQELSAGSLSMQPSSCLCSAGISSLATSVHPALPDLLHCCCC